MLVEPDPSTLFQAYLYPVMVSYRPSVFLASTFAIILVSEAAWLKNKVVLSEDVYSVGAWSVKNLRERLSQRIDDLSSIDLDSALSDVNFELAKTCLSPSASHTSRTRDLPILGMSVIDTDACGMDPVELCSTLGELGEGHSCSLNTPIELDIIMDSKQVWSNGDSEAQSLPNDEFFEHQWGLHRVGWNSTWSAGRVGAEDDVRSVVGVIDTGVDHFHEDLMQQMWVNEAERDGEWGVDDDGNGYIDDVFGWNFRDNSNNTWDDHYHGTHCSGIIGAATNNIRGTAGMAPNVRVMALKFLTGGGTADAVEAIEYGIANGAHVLSNSWGSYELPPSIVTAVDRATKAGVLFVASAGNAAIDNDTEEKSPCNAEGALCVAALNNTDTLARFSNYGLTKVHVAAPGVKILAPIPTDQVEEEEDEEEEGVDGKTRKGVARSFSSSDDDDEEEEDEMDFPENYDLLSGTSMACPMVSGLAALLRAELVRRGAEGDMEVVRSLILRSAEALPELEGKVATGGVIDVDRAMALLEEELH